MKASLLALVLVGGLAAHGCAPVLAQAPALRSAAEIEAASRAYFPTALAILDTFLRIPNESHDLVNARRNADYCQRAFERRGFSVEQWPTSTAPFVFAERRSADPAAKTLLFYLQIDGQPVDPTKWDQPDPYVPVLKHSLGDGRWETLPLSAAADDFDPEWRLFARSASDSKGPATCLLAALDVLAKAGLTPGFHIKVIMDLEEEISSPNLPATVKEKRARLAADALVIMDGTRHISNRPTLTFGARGIAEAKLTVFGPTTALHSGQYGNYAPNPAFGLAHLLASMKDASGRVTVPGWYEGVEISAADSARLAVIPEDEPALLRRIGVAVPEAVGDGYQSALQYPSLNVRGMAAAYVGEQARTVIPATAVAELDLRLVPETPGARQLALLRSHVEAQGYHLVDSVPTAEERARYPRLASLAGEVSYEAFRTSFDAPVGAMLERALVRAFGHAPVLMRTTGGSQPMGPFILELGIDAVALRIPNPDNNIHSPNENLRLGNFLEGIQSCVAVLTERY